jgi:SRSO17 transposase
MGTVMEEIAVWEERLETLLARMAPCFRNALGRQRLALYVRGLLGNVPRKNGWQLAEEAGEATPYAMQQFIYRGGWDLNGLRRETRGFVAEHLGDTDGVLVGDETGFLKKGTHSVGVQRQYSGTAGRVENCQVGVFLGYVSPRGRALLDAELYLPVSWTKDRERCDKAGVPASTGFQTKPALFRSMLKRALDEGIQASWATADSVYGDNPQTRTWLERQRLAYVLGTSLNDARVPINLRMRSLKAVVSELTAEDWQRLSAGEGSQGPRWYDWQVVELSTFPHRDWRRGVLVRRSLNDPTKLAVYRCFYPVGTSLSKLVQVAGCRWTIETDIEEAKGEVGLDHYEVRSWDGWHRHISLAVLAHAFLAVTKALGEVADMTAVKGGPMDRPTATMAAFRASRGLLCP